MANHWNEFEVSIEHPNEQEYSSGQRIERGTTTVDTGNVLFTEDEKVAMRRLIASNYGKEKDDAGELLSEKYKLTQTIVPPERRKRRMSVQDTLQMTKNIEPSTQKQLQQNVIDLERIFGDNFDEFVLARLEEGINNYEDSLLSESDDDFFQRTIMPIHLQIPPDTEDRHKKQVDVAAEIFGALGGKVSKREKDYEKVREDSIENMRNNKVYQFCMLLSGFTNERMDKYWITPSEKGSIPLIVSSDGEEVNYTDVVIKDIADMGTTDGKKYSVHFIAANKEMWISESDLKRLAGVYFPRRMFGEVSLQEGDKLKVDVNKLMHSGSGKTMEAVSMNAPSMQPLTRDNYGMDESINSRPEIGGRFHNWYVSTSWADGKLHLSPMVYAHLEESHNMIIFKWNHLFHVPLHVFVESVHLRTYFARLVAFNMRASDVLSGKRYHSNATYPRINSERARLLNVFRHVTYTGDDIVYSKNKDDRRYVSGVEDTEYYLDQMATKRFRGSNTETDLRLYGELNRMRNLTQSILADFT